MTLRATLRWTGCVCSAIQTTAHAALADLLEELVGPDDGAGAFAQRLVHRRRACRRGIQESLGFLVSQDKGLHSARSG